MKNIQVCTFNCKNIKTSIEEVRELCCTADIIFLQETWLFEQELSLLSNISDKHYAKGVSSIDSSLDIMTGRPFGGLGILWQKSIGKHCKIVEYQDDKRLLGIEITDEQHKALFINTYLPYCNTVNLPQFYHYLAKINDIIETSDTPFAMAVGDFNVDLLSQQKFGTELLKFCKEENYILSDYIYLQDDSLPYTFVSNHNSTSWLDHIMATHSAHALIKNIYIKYDKVSSDHLPLIMNIILDPSRSTETVDANHASTIKWDKVSTEDVETYKKNTATNQLPLISLK